MPQPLKEPHTGILFDPNPIKTRPEASAALANAITVWNLFEWDLVIAYSIAMGFYLPGFKGWEPTNHPLAFQIFDALAGLGARLDLLERCVSLVAPSLAAEFIAMRPEIRRIAGKRAVLAHGRWGTNDHYPRDIILSPVTGRNTRWSANDLDNCAKQFTKLRSDFVKFELRLREAAKNRPGLRQPPEPLAPANGPLSPK